MLVPKISLIELAIVKIADPDANPIRTGREINLTTNPSLSQPITSIKSPLIRVITMTALMYSAGESGGLMLPIPDEISKAGIDMGPMAPCLDVPKKA